MELDPPAFEGKTDPEAAESWIREIERIFRVLDVPEEQKVNFGTYRLKDHAEKWWDTVSSVKFKDTNVTWDEFVEVFNSAYFPKHERSKKMQEFLDLQQGTMTLSDYITKFRCLERYCPNVYVAENDRAMKFARGLRPTLRTKVFTSGPKSLEEAIEVATLLDEDQAEPTDSSFCDYE